MKNTNYPISIVVSVLVSVDRASFRMTVSAVDCKLFDPLGHAAAPL